MSGEYMGARLTVGIKGSFGILQYAFLALTGSSVIQEVESESSQGPVLSLATCWNAGSGDHATATLRT